MPTYEYACTKCKDQFEIVQSFSDDALTTCEKCGADLRKVFGSVGIVFKGSGFYKNDSRGKSSSTTSAGTSEKSSADTSTAASTSTSKSTDSSSSSTSTSSTSTD
jgi:putative FmdB family regulatory protein